MVPGGRPGRCSSPCRRRPRTGSRPRCSALPLPWRAARRRRGRPVARGRPVRAAAAQSRRPRRRVRQDLPASRRARIRSGSATWSAARSPARPRAGNPSPRIARSRRHGSIVNAMGLPNPGAGRGRGHAAATGRRARRRGSSASPTRTSTTPSSSVELLEPLVDGLELNASCPNVSWGRDRDNESHLRGPASPRSGRARPSRSS